MPSQQKQPVTMGAQQMAGSQGMAQGFASAPMQGSWNVPPQYANTPALNTGMPQPYQPFMSPGPALQRPAYGFTGQPMPINSGFNFGQPSQYMSGCGPMTPSATGTGRGKSRMAQPGMGNSGGFSGGNMGPSINSMGMM